MFRRSLAMVVVDLVVAVARGTAELPPLAALVRVCLADPGTKRPGQFRAVRPEIRVVARVRAQFVARTVVLAHAARLPRHVRMTQATLVVAAANRNDWRGIRKEIESTIFVDEDLSLHLFCCKCRIKKKKKS